MPTRMKSALLLGPALAALVSCAHRPPPPPPPCQGDACRQWPHVELRFWRNQGPPRGRRYTGALCVQVSFDCPEEGRHQVWIEPQAPRCTTFVNAEGAPEWLRVENGRLSIPWPARCRGSRVEMYVTAQPNFATCDAVNGQLLTAERSTLGADLTFQCR